MPKGRPQHPFHIKKHPVRLPYMWNEGGGSGKEPTPNVTRVRNVHGAKLLKQLRETEKNAKGNDFEELGEDYLADKGDLLTFIINPTFKNKLETFDSITSGVELLSLRTVKDIKLGEVLIANVFVSHGKLKYFISKLEAYAAKEDNKPFADQIERISEATLKALWTSEAPLPKAGKNVWWEVWLRRGKNDQTRSENLQSVLSEAKRLKLDVQASPLELPEHTIILLEAEIDQLSHAFGILNCVAELREPKLATLSAAQPTAVTEDVAPLPAVHPSNDAPAVCIFDTGVNNDHPYLQSVCPGNHATSWSPAWSTADDNGHGTAMAGLAAFGDLRPLQLGRASLQATHWLESVKMLDLSEPHKPKNYGAVTIECAGRIESLIPNRTSRVFSMSVSATDAIDYPDLAPDGLPTSWSASIDLLVSASGFIAGPPRNFVVSCGNIDPDACGGYAPGTYPGINHKSSIEDPAHAWNAISVGAITHLQDDSRKCIASIGTLSPYSTTSLSWIENGTKDCPLKPELVFEGGNLLSHHDSTYCQDTLHLLTLHPLTLHHDFIGQGLFSSSSATSAATAGISHLLAQLHAALPEATPETIRGLLIHSARWTPAMIGRANLKKKAEVERLVRTYGYGEPSVNRLLEATENRATFYFEEELQPFDKINGTLGTKEMLYFPLPIPKEKLQEFGGAKLRMTVTLSYFISPNPGRRGLAVSKFRYANCGLRFDLKTGTESYDTFVSSRSKRIQDKLELDKTGDRGETSDGWRLGIGNQSRGSLHQDQWEGTASALAARDGIVVYPVNGWWKLRPHLKQWDQKQRFSLIVSIESDDPAHEFSTQVQEEITNLTVPQRIRELAALFSTSVDVDA